MSALRDSSSDDDDIAAIVNLNNTLLGKPLYVVHQFGLQWRTSGVPRISSHWYLLPVAHALMRHG
jgi:hypothetical protein